MARPKGAKAKIDKASIRDAWQELARTKPWLIKEALENGLAGSRPLGFLELGAKLMREIGAQEDSKPQIAIIFNGGLDTSKLRPGSEPIRIIETQSHPMLPSPSRELPEVLPLQAEEAELLEGDDIG